MILRSKEELLRTRELLARGLNTLAVQRAAFAEMGATPEQIERGLGPMRCFVGDLEDQIASYEEKLKPAIAAKVLAK